MRYELHRRLSKAGVPFTQVRHELLVPAHRGPWVQTLMADVALDALDAADAAAEPVPRPYDPLARVDVPGVGEPAGRGQRLGGYLIDASLFVLPARAAAQLDAPTWVAWAALAVQAVVVVVMVTMVGASPGKLAVGTRVVGFDAGGRVSWWRSVVRWLVPNAGLVLFVVDPLFAWVGLAVWFANVGFVLFHPEGRAVHDLAAGTIVVRADGIAPAPR